MMQAFLQPANRFLDEPIGLAARLMLLVAAALLVATYFFPLWNLTMFAPQYPEGLRLDIYSYTLVGGNNGQDVKEINVLNHYIGMQDLVNESFTEFKWMPFVIGALGLLVLRATAHGTVVALVDVTMLFVYFGGFSLWSFGYKLYRYGHDLSPETSPIEAGLTFGINKRRRIEGGFPGADRILREIAEGTARKWVGLALDGRQAAREGAEVFAGSNAVGSVTSGGFSPTLGHPVAVAYVDVGYAAEGTALEIEVRGKRLPARVVPLPFVQHRYRRKGTTQ